MSDSPGAPTTPDSGGGQNDAGSVKGKGWDILVGGKNNLASGGDDPFDTATPPLSAVEGSTASKDAETDRILQPTSAMDDMETAAPLVQREATLDSPVPVEPGVSAGVVVSPVGASAPPMSQQPPASAPAYVPPAVSGPVVPASPSSSAIVEVDGGAQVYAAPSAPGSSSVIMPAPSAPSTVSAGVVEVQPGMPIPSVPAPRVAPGPMNVVGSAPVPPIMGVSGYGMSSPFEVNDPFATQSGLKISIDAKDLPTNPELEAQLVTRQRVDALWDDITKTYDMVINDVRGHFKTTDQALAQLREARELLLAGKENFDNAEQLVMSVKARLRLEEKVRQWSRTSGFWLATYLVLWLILLSLASTAKGTIEAIALEFKLDPWMAETYMPALCGALGGVIGALYVLIKHTTFNRDFDPIHTMWYVSNPFMGGALGTVTYFIVRGGGFIITDLASNGGFTLTPAVALSLYAICIVVGFNQNILWALIDRFLKTIFPQKDEDRSAATDMKPDDGSASDADKPKGP